MENRKKLKRFNENNEPVNKRIRLDDTLDPVEKLLSLSNDNYYYQDFLFNEQEDFNLNNINQDIKQYNESTISFTKMLNDNLINFYKQSDSFIPLESSTVDDNTKLPVQNNSNLVPFFRTVNFNPKPKVHLFDELISLDPKAEDIHTISVSSDFIDTSSPGLIADVISESESESELDSRKNSNLELSSKEIIGESPKINHELEYSDKLTPKNWIYRQSNCLNLSNFRPQNDCKILNDSSILSGNSSQMIGLNKFLINDFFL